MGSWRARDETDFAAILDLIRAAFAYMDGRIDPPSSMHRLSVRAMAAHDGETWALGPRAAPHACMVLTPTAEGLYLGKLAVRADRRGRGLAGAMVGLAMDRALLLGHEDLILQVRVELTENRAVFERLGFRMIRQSAHPGFDRPTSITMARKVDRR